MQPLIEISTLLLSQNGMDEKDMDEEGDTDEKDETEDKG
jgi:hypothetical protein